MNKFHIITETEEYKGLCPIHVQIEFDYKNSKHDVYRDEIGLIIWCCIKYCHLTISGFKDEVMSVVKRIKEEIPRTYSDFKDIISSGPLRSYGTLGF